MTTPERSVEEIVEALEKKIDEWLETTEHTEQCIGYSEGQACCLCKGEQGSIYGEIGRDKVIMFVKETLQTERQKREEVVEERMDIAIYNLVFSGLSIAQMDKLPKWLLENMDKNKPKFIEALTQPNNPK